MTDVHTPEIRSYNMSRIKDRDTKPELIVRKFLHRNGFRFRLHVKNLPGKPDLVLKKYKTVIFVHGCFWHGHQGCKYFKIPKSNSEWWKNKINSNVERDKRQLQELSKLGWKTKVIWECQLKKYNREKTFVNLIPEIRNFD